MLNKNISMISFLSILVVITTIVMSNIANADPGIKECLTLLKQFNFFEENSGLINFLNAIKILEYNQEIALYEDAYSYYKFILKEADKMMGAEKWCNLEYKEDIDEQAKCLEVLQNYGFGSDIGLKNYSTLMKEQVGNFKKVHTKFNKSTMYAVQYVYYMLELVEIEMNFVNPHEWCESSPTLLLDTEFLMKT